MDNGGKWLLVVLGAIMALVLLFAGAVPLFQATIEHTQQSTIEDMIAYWLEQGYVAYASPDGTLHVYDIEPNDTCTYDLGSLSKYFRNIYINGELVTTGTVTGDLIPTDNDTYDLGSATHRWKDLYITDGSIYLGGRTISDNGTQLKVDDTYISAPGTPDYVVGVNTATDDVPGSSGYWVKSGSTGQVVRSTASPADDDIQWAINALPVSGGYKVGGGKVMSTEGIFIISAQITTWGIPNLTLGGSGWNSVWKMADGANINNMIALWWYNNHLENLKLDGNKANQTSFGTLVMMDSPYDDVFQSVDNCLFVDSYFEGIRTANSNANSRYAIRNNIFLDCGAAAIFIGSTGAIVEGNNIIDCATVSEHPISSYFATRALIANNVIDGGGIFGGSQIYLSNASYFTILGNVCKSSIGAGIACSNSYWLTITGNNVIDPAQQGIAFDTTCYQITITGNSVKGAGSQGLHIGGPDYVTIIGNVIEDCFDNGIDTGGSVEVDIIGNVIRGMKNKDEGHGLCLDQQGGVVSNNIIEYCAENGIITGADAKDIRITNNIVKNCRQDPGGAFPPEAGIAVEGYSDLACTGILIQGNRVFDDQGGTSLLTADPAPGQKVVVVADGTQFKVYQAVTILDDTPDTEDNIIQSISGNTLTMRTNLAHTYTMAQNAVVNGRQTQDYGISIKNYGGATVIECQVCDNDLDGNILGGLLLTLVGGTTDAKIYRNRGYVTENSGTATILSGQTVIQVTHGLAITPDKNKIKLTALEIPTNHPRMLSVSDNATATYFWIVTDSDPGASNLDVGWSYAN